MTNNRDDLITMAEIQRITQHCQNLLSYTARLRRNEEIMEAHTSAEGLFSSIRKLVISSLMYRRTLICVSGLQGAGKTTLMKNFYGLGDQYLLPTLGRGERLPILITEKKDAVSVSAHAVRFDEDEKKGYIRSEVTLSEEEFASSVTGADEKIMYLELCVPFKHTHHEGISFLLLPGFERKSEYWNNLIEFSVNSSDAAIFVFNETSFSNAANEDCLNWIEKRFGKNLVYAITGSDCSADDNAAVKETCLQTLGIPATEADRVVCTGDYADQAQNDAWITAFKTALERYAYNNMEQLGKNSQYLYHEAEEITKILYQIQGVLNQAADAVQIDDHSNDAKLKLFDAAVEKQRRNFERELDDQFKTAKKQSVDNLYEQFNNMPKLSMIKRFFLGNDLKQYRKTEEIIIQSLQDGSYFLPNKYMGLALYNSLTALDQPEGRTELGRLVDSDTERNDKGQLQLTCGENVQAMVNDVRVLLADPREGQTTAVLQCRNPKRLMRSMAELGTYYFSLMSYDGIAMDIGLGAYEPATISMVPQHMISGAESSKKFVAGMAGMMGVDLLGDGTINMVSQIAVSLGVSVPIAGAVAIAAVGAGAMTAILRDMIRMQREDFTSASIAVKDVYDQIKLNVLEKYDRYMECIRDRMEDNIDATHQNGRQIIDLYNAQREISMALDLLETISDRASGEIFIPWRWG